MITICSGGQTGADQAALDAAIFLNLPYDGWLPQGRLTENGPLPDHYQLKELSSPLYRIRTEKNITDTQATLIFSFGPLTGGSALTEALAIKHERPVLHLDCEVVDTSACIKAIEQWLARHQPQRLNVAGSRASGEPRIYDTVYGILTQVKWQQG